MGLFDYVNFEMPCPKCGEKMDDWQSKSGDCTMATVDPTAVAYFYGGCDKCRISFDFSRQTNPTKHRETPFTAAEVEAMGFIMTRDG